MGFITVQGHRIEYEFLDTAPAGAPVLVFLHEGLGSIAMWKDFPTQCARASGCRGLVYSRYGYGKSDPLTAPRGVRFMHDEALDALPELLDKLEVRRPVLLGHSDGASIALIYAAASPHPPRGLILMAPHTIVEDVSIRSIEAATQSYATTDLRARLARYHDDPDSAFRGWNDIWLDPEFRCWNLDEYLPRIDCPVLAMQGEDDQYGTMEQIERIRRAIPAAEVLALNNCRHSPHRDQPAAVIARVAQFVSRWIESPASPDIR